MRMLSTGPGGERAPPGHKPPRAPLQIPSRRQLVPRPRLHQHNLRLLVVMKDLPVACVVCLVGPKVSSDGVGGFPAGLVRVSGA
jgi:hypothetical protein